MRGSEKFKASPQAIKLGAYIRGRVTASLEGKTKTNIMGGRLFEGYAKTVSEEYYPKYLVNHIKHFQEKISNHPQGFDAALQEWVEIFFKLTCDFLKEAVKDDQLNKILVPFLKGKPVSYLISGLQYNLMLNLISKSGPFYRSISLIFSSGFVIKISNQFFSHEFSKEKSILEELKSPFEADDKNQSEKAKKKLSEQIAFIKEEAFISELAARLTAENTSFGEIKHIYQSLNDQDFQSLLKAMNDIITMDIESFNARGALNSLCRAMNFLSGCEKFSSPIFNNFWVLLNNSPKEKTILFDELSSNPNYVLFQEKYQNFKFEGDQLFLYEARRYRYIENRAANAILDIKQAKNKLEIEQSILKFRQEEKNMQKSRLGPPSYAAKRVNEAATNQSQKKSVIYGSINDPLALIQKFKTDLSAAACAEAVDDMVNMFNFRMAELTAGNSSRNNHAQNNYFDGVKKYACRYLLKIVLNQIKYTNTIADIKTQTSLSKAAILNFLPNDPRLVEKYHGIIDVNASIKMLKLSLENPDAHLKQLKTTHINRLQELYTTQKIDEKLFQQALWVVDRLTMPLDTLILEITDRQAEQLEPIVLEKLLLISAPFFRQSDEKKSGDDLQDNIVHAFRRKIISLKLDENSLEKWYLLSQKLSGNTSKTTDTLIGLGAALQEILIENVRNGFENEIKNVKNHEELSRLILNYKTKLSHLDYLPIEVIERCSKHMDQLSKEKLDHLKLEKARIKRNITAYFKAHPVQLKTLKTVLMSSAGLLGLKLLAPHIPPHVIADLGRLGVAAIHPILHTSMGHVASAVTLGGGLVASGIGLFKRNTQPIFDQITEVFDQNFKDYQNTWAQRAAEIKSEDVFSDHLDREKAIEIHKKYENAFKIRAYQGIANLKTKNPGSFLIKMIAVIIKDQQPGQLGQILAIHLKKTFGIQEASDEALIQQLEALASDYSATEVQQVTEQLKSFIDEKPGKFERQLTKMIVSEMRGKHDDFRETYFEAKDLNGKIRCIRDTLNSKNPVVSPLLMALKKIIDVGSPDREIFIAALDNCSAGNHQHRAMHLNF